MLRQILLKYGKEICSDARRCENLLKDLCGSFRRETNVLVNAIEERVPLDLLAANRSMPLELLLTKLEKRLEEQTAMTADAARWTVESWALALNLTTENEIQVRRKRIESVAAPVSKPAAVQPDDSVRENINSNVNRSSPIQSPQKPTSVPQTPRTAPPIIRQPIQPPKSTPPVVYQTNNQPNIQQTTNQATAARKGFGIFRGCLLVIFLLAIASVVLFFGVPYAIEQMRETQRERNNEPPRFPVR